MTMGGQLEQSGRGPATYLSTVTVPCEVGRGPDSHCRRAVPNTIPAHVPSSTSAVALQCLTDLYREAVWFASKSEWALRATKPTTAPPKRRVPPPP
jgi:hypothetical protein